MSPDPFQCVDGLWVLLFVPGDQVVEPQHELQCVHTVDQTLAGEAVERETARSAAGQCHGRCLHINDDDSRRILREAREKIGVRVPREDNGNDAVLERVLPEDVGERRADDCAEAELGKRPGGVLARTAAAEVVAGEQDLALSRAPA